MMFMIPMPPRHRVGGVRRRDDVVQVFPAGQLLHDRRVRHERLVVLVRAAGSRPALGHDAEHAEQVVAHADRLAGRVDELAEQRLGDVVTQHENLGRRSDVVLGEEAAEFDPPGPDVRHVDVGALDAGVPVLVAEDDLLARADFFGYPLQIRQRAQDRCVIRTQANGGAAAAPDAAHVRAARPYRDQVGARGAHLLLDGGLRAGAERDQRDDGRHADDHAQHRERGPHLVTGQGLERDPNGHQHRHGVCNSVGPL
jgi:hypothetical protein